MTEAIWSSRLASSGRRSMRAASTPCRVSGISNAAERLGQDPLLALAGNGSLVDQHADDFLDEERIALGLGEDQGPDAFRQRLDVEQVAHQFLAVGLGERRQVELDRAAAGQIAGRLEQPPAGRLHSRAASTNTTISGSP